MKSMHRNTVKVLLHGVSRNSLIIGRACTLNDNPVVGVYDPDPERALRAALFLGVPAQPTTERLFANPAEIVVCTTPSEHQFDGLVMNLFAPAGEAASGVCYLESREPDSPEFPLEISNVLPPLSFQLSGDPEAVKQGVELLRAFSDRFEARPRD